MMSRARIHGVMPLEKMSDVDAGDLQPSEANVQRSTPNGERGETN